MSVPVASYDEDAVIYLHPAIDTSHISTESIDLRKNLFGGPFLGSTFNYHVIYPGNFIDYKKNDI